eukprot:m.304956 g.304956  ORF g.304956 m.304956 type:complete len:204 (-) comp16443_c5_seq2:31-642(-)
MSDEDTVLSLEELENILKGKKLVDKSCRVIGVAARDPITSHCVVVKIFPLRIADHALRKGEAPGSGRKNKWMCSNPTPWPNLYWLVCPVLQKRIGRLEHQGFVKKFRARLLNDKSAQEELLRNHRTFANERWNLLSEDEQRYCVKQNYDAVLRDYGVGGVEYPFQVKCLHAHYAHYLAEGRSGNLIGQWVQDELDKELPDSGP